MPITVTIPAGAEAYDSEASEFLLVDKDVHITLEHSLVSLHKWEQHWHVPFLDKNQDKTHEQILDYLRCMTLSKHVEDFMYYLIPRSEIERVKEYIEDSMTATTIKDTSGRPDREIKTAEVLYSDMIMLNIPFECRKWHLNSLIMLIRVCAEKKKPQKYKPRSEVLAENRALNQARKLALHTRG